MSLAACLPARRALRRRPAAALAGAGALGVLGLCALGRARRTAAGPTADDALLLPRDRYDPAALAAHWSARPLDAAARLVRVAGALGPVVGAYAWRWHLRPRLLLDPPTTEEGREELERDLAAKLRAALTALGPTFVKIGQQLSIRPDLVSPTVLSELQQLCDAVPPFADDVAMKVLAEDLLLSRGIEGAGSLDAKKVEEVILGDFQDMPRRVASASLGQVYKGTLRPSRDDAGADRDARDDVPDAGEEVAIKIQRPDILETVSLDLFLLASYGKLVDRLCSLATRQTPYHQAFLEGFAGGAWMELNYLHEADHQRFFREALRARFRGDRGRGGLLPFLRPPAAAPAAEVVVPAVHARYTTRRTLVSEWIEGVPLARAPPDQIRRLIPVGVELFLCQLLDLGRFHADPHPGNLYVTTSKVDGITPTLCLLDFGLVAHVSEGARDDMTRAIVHLLQGDYDTLIARDAKQLGFLPSDMDVTPLTPVLTTILKEGLVEAGSNLHDRRRNLMAISNELNEVFFRYPFSVPPFFALVTRGLGLLEGIALTGDPSFDIFQASYPYAKRRAMETFSVKDYGKMSRGFLSLR